MDVVESTRTRTSPWRPLLLGLPVLLALLACGAALLTWYELRWELQREWGRGFFVAGALLVLAAVPPLVLLLARGRGWWRGTWRPCSLAPLRAAFVCVVLAGAAYVAFVDPYEEMSAQLALAFGLVSFALGALLAPALARRLPRGLLRAVDFALFQACLLLVLAELLLGPLARWSSAPLLDLDAVPAADRIARWRMQPGRMRAGFPVNSHGDYDEEPSPPPREHPLVVCIGDSFSSGVVPHFAHFTTVAEQFRSDVEFYNMGMPYVDLREYELLLVEEALPLEPDLVVIDVFVGNDLEEEVYGRRGGLESWLSRGELRLVRLGVRIRRLRAEEAARSVGAVPVGAGPGAGGPARRLSRAKVEEWQPWLKDPTHERPTFSAELFEEMELRRARVVCDPERDYGPSLARLDRIVAAAGEVSLAVMLIPDEFQVEDALWARLVELTPGERLERDRPQRELAAWSAARGVPLLDLLPELRAVEPMADGRRRLYHLQDSHFNARGNRIAGQALARFAAGLLGGQ